MTRTARHAFPDRTPPHYAALRHYFVGCHDASGEFLARDMKIEVTTGSYGEAAHEALQRPQAPQTNGDRPESCTQRPARSAASPCHQLPIN